MQKSVKQVVTFVSVEPVRFERLSASQSDAALGALSQREIHADCFCTQVSAKNEAY
jgi:hypothetical protein